MSHKKQISIIAIAWIFWLTVLPYPFTAHATKCAVDGTNCTFVDTYEWAWSGGYHIFVEHIFFFDSIDQLYLGFTYPGVVGYVGVSLLFAAISFVVISVIQNILAKRSRNATV